MSSTWKNDIIVSGDGANARKTAERRQTYLLDSFSGQHDRAVISHADAVLNADSDPPKLLRPSLVVGDVDTAGSG